MVAADRLDSGRGTYPKRVDVVLAVEVGGRFVVSAVPDLVDEPAHLPLALSNFHRSPRSLDRDRKGSRTFILASRLGRIEVAQADRDPAQIRKCLSPAASPPRFSGGPPRVLGVPSFAPPAAVWCRRVCWPLLSYLAPVGIGDKGCGNVASTSPTPVLTSSQRSPSPHHFDAHGPTRQLGRQSTACLQRWWALKAEAVASAPVARSSRFSNGQRSISASGPPWRAMARGVLFSIFCTAAGAPTGRKVGSQMPSPLSPKEADTGTEKRNPGAMAPSRLAAYGARSGGRSRGGPRSDLR